MADVTATITLKGDYRDGLNQEELVTKISDAIERESKVLEVGGFKVEECKVVVNGDPALDPRTGIEEPRSYQRRLCLDCREALGHAHLSGCRYNGVVLTLQSGLYDD